jgi:phosphatidylinositol-3-phosphatase
MNPPSDQAPPPPPPPPNYDGIPHIGHVALVVFENQQEDQILKNPNMPWLTNLALQNSYTSNYFADVHPSLGNYFMLTTGQIISNDLNFDGVVTDDNLVRQLVKAGKSWKAYEESLPAPGYLGDGPLPYVKTHNPAAYFADVRNEPAQASNMVPLTQLQTDLDAGTLPEFMFIEPNQINSTHDCPADHQGCDNDYKLMVGDTWAQQNLGALLNNPTFQQDGLLIITWDESWDSDSQHGGGGVLTILVGPKVKTQYESSTFYQHESTLRLICDAVRIPCMGNATTAPAMTEFFNTQ